MTDITQTGPVGLTGIKGIGQQAQQELSDYSKAIRSMSGRQLSQAYIPDEEIAIGVALAESGYGESIYDDAIQSVSQLNDIQDIRAQEQPWYAQLGAGVAKGLALAGTTFLDGTIGLVTGAVEGIGAKVKGDSWGDSVAKLWDNEVSNGLASLNESLEEILPNYRTQEEQDNPWYKNLGTMNFWADSVIKNLGFAVGAFYSGGAWNKALKAIGALKGAMGAKITGSVLSAVNEGRIEANHGASNFLDLQFAEIVDAAIEQGNLEAQYLKSVGLSDEEILDQLSQEDANIARITEDARNRTNAMGLTTLIGNTVLLSLNNFDTFGKLYARGYKNARTIAKGRVTKEAMSKGLDKAAIEVAQEEAGKRISKEGGKYVYDEISKKRAIARGLRHGLVEGNEELAQAFISETAGQMQSPDSPDAYYEALLDPNAEIETKNLLKSVTEGFTNTYGNGDRWEEFAVGAITGLLGIPTFGKVQNSDANTWLGRGKTIGISGGLFGEIGLANKENAEGNEAVNFMNDYAQKVQEHVGHFVRSQSFTNAMDGWAEEDDAFEYKNAEDNSDFSAISRFAKVGRLGDLKDMVSQDFENLPDEELEKIAEFTSPEDGVGGWRNPDGSLMSDTEEGREEMRYELSKKRDKILSEIDKYESSIETVRAIGNNSLNEDQVNELAWLNWKVGVFTDRYNSVKEENRNFLQDMLQGIQAFQRGRGRGVIDEDSEEGKNIIKAIDNTEMFIEALQTSKTPLQLASLIESNPRLMNFIEEIAYPILEDMVGIDAATFEKSMNDLKDAVRIAKATKSFNQRYKEFRENPIKLIENRATITKKKEKVAQAVNDVNLKDKVSNSSVSDIVLGIEHGDLNIAELDGLFSGEDTNFLNNIVTPEGAATPTGREKVEEAKRIIETSDRMSTAISELDDDSIDPQAIEDALTLVRRSKEVSESEQEMLDTTTQAYNDPSLLYNESDPSMQGISQEEIASALDDRLDAAKSVIEQAKAIIAEQNEELSDLPTGKPIATFKKEDATDETKAAKATIVTPETTKAESTGHDATPKVVTENERRKEVEAKTAEQQAKTVEQGKVNDFFNEARQEVAPENVKDFDKALSETLSNIDMLLSKNTPTKDLGRAIKDTQSYKVLKALVPSIDELLDTYVTYKTKPTTTPKVEEKTARTPIITNDDVRVQTTAQLGNDPNKGELTPTYQYWKPTLSYLPFGKAYQKGNTTPFYAIARTLKNANGTPMFTEAQLRRIEAVGKYLEEHGTFRLVDSGEVKVGDKVSFVIDSALNDDAGEIVILMADSQGRIIGDVMSQNDVSFQRQAYLPAFVEKVMQEYKDAGSPQHFTASLTTVVDKNMVGKIPYLADHEEMNTLNDIHSDENTPVPFLIGVAASSGSNVRVLASAGRTKRQGQSDLERSINPPLVAKAGQPFLLMPTSSAVNHYMPVPIMMDPYSPSTQGTALGQAIHKVLERVTTADNSSAIGIIRDLEELISVQEIHINYSGDNVKVTIKPNGAEHQMTIYNGTKNAPNIVEQLELGLQGQPFQVSRKYMNEDYNGQDYNRMIGEVAKTNLPIGATHTVSDWFTLKPIDAAGNVTKAKSPRSIGRNPHAAELPVITLTRKGMQLQVNPKTWEVSDGKKTYEGQNADTARALAFGIYTNQNMKQPYDTEWGYYDPTKDEFVEKPNRVLRTLGEPQHIAMNTKDAPKGTFITTIGGKQYVTTQVYNSADDTDFTDYYRLNNKGELEKAGIWTLDAENIKSGKKPLEWTPVTTMTPQREEIVTYLKRFPSQWDSPLESQEVLKEKAKKAGLLGNATREVLWSFLTQEQQSIIANKRGPKQKQWMDVLELAFNPISMDFDETKLKGSVDDFLGRKEMYRRTDGSGSVWNRERETQWLSKVLPNLSTEEHLRIVEGVEKIPTHDGGYAYGKFQEGVITLAGLTTRGTMYHEAFHAVTHTLLSPQEYKELFNTAKKKWGNLSKIALEENLAEDFRRYVQLEETPIVGMAIKIYRTLKHLIQNLLGKEIYINKLYYDINRGKLADRQTKQSKVTRYSVISELDEINYDIEEKDSQLKNISKQWGKVAKIAPNKWYTSYENGKAVRYKYYSTIGYSVGEAINAIPSDLQEVLVVREDRGKEYILIDRKENVDKKKKTLESSIKTLKDKLPSLEAKAKEERMIEASEELLQNEEVYYREIEQYHRDKLLFDNLSQEDKSYLQERGISDVEYKDMTQLEREVLFKCKY